MDNKAKDMGWALIFLFIFLAIILSFMSTMYQGLLHLSGFRSEFTKQHELKSTKEAPDSFKWIALIGICVMALVGWVIDDFMTAIYWSIGFTLVLFAAAMRIHFKDS